MFDGDYLIGMEAVPVIDEANEPETVPQSIRSDAVNSFRMASTLGSS
jgi:hypothetical protein